MFTEAPILELRNIVDRAEREAFRKDWEQYEYERRRFLEEVRRIDLGPSKVLIRHGTRTQYDKGCRCASCKSHHNKYMREYNFRKRIVKRHYKGAKPKHGTQHKYSQGCRCQKCKDEINRIRRERYWEKKRLQNGDTTNGTDTRCNDDNINNDSAKG